MLIIYSGIFVDIQAADLKNLKEVLEIFQDSRKTRDLKESDNIREKQAFMDTLENQVYKPVDQAVIEKISQLPEYEGKRIITHDFRTPGDNGVNVNTDRDVRVLVEVELDRWEEVSVAKWEDTYYREFARRTGYRSGKNLEDLAIKDLKKHAGRYRQLPTDKFHMEASRDFSDVDTVRVYGSNENYKLISTPNIVRAKKGLSRLKDPEGLAYMYWEKADEQFREAREVELDIEQRVKDKIPLSTPERVYYEDIKSMYEVEGTVQLKKGIETLETLRESYQKMGYDTGRLPPEMLEAREIIKGVKGTSDTDINKIKTQLDKLGFQGLDDLNQKVSSQLESLKMARKYQKPRIKPDLSLKTAGKWAGIAGDLISIKDSLEKARQGNHLLFNFERKDSMSIKTIKTLAVAAVELAPLPVLDALERGWQVDEEEKEYLMTMNINGRAGGWETHPLTSIARVSTKITYQTVKSMTIDPLIAGKTAVNEGYQAFGDISRNFLADFERTESERLQQERMQELQERSEEFGLGILLGEKAGGISLVNGVNPGEVLEFSTTRNENWTDNYQIRWELELEPGNALIIKEITADTVNAENLKLEVPILSPGDYTIYLRVFDRRTNLQVDFCQISFPVSDEIGLTEISASKGNFVGKPLVSQAGRGVPLDGQSRSGDLSGKQNKGSISTAGRDESIVSSSTEGGEGAAQENQVEIGDILAFKVDRIGNWSKQYSVEWLVNGERFKYNKASNPKIHLFRFTTDELLVGNYKVAVRILDNQNKIYAHRDYSFNVIDSKEIRLNKFSIRGSHNNYDGPVINRSIENGEILAFQAEIKHPIFREKITPVTRLIWQVYDSRGSPLPGLTKVTDVVESGISKGYQFRFRAENMPNGKYYVQLKQVLLTKGIENESRYDFGVYQAVRINRVLVTDNKERQEDRQYLYIDQAPLFYVYYDLAEGQEVNIRLTASKNGSTLEDIPVERPREGETAPYRIGMGLKKNIFEEGDIVDFAVEISNKNGDRDTSHKRIQFVSYKLKLIIPDSIRTGEDNQFEIRVPANFRNPYKVDISVGKGLGVGYQPGQLTGTVNGIVTGKAKRVFLKARVTDAVGTTAEASKEILVEPRKASVGTPHLNQQLIDAVVDGDINRAKSLLEKGASPNSRYNDNKTLLHYDYYSLCYITEYLRIVELLLDYGGDINRLAEYGTPLYYITDFTYSMSGLDPIKIEEKQMIITEITRLFIEYGADVNLRRQGRHSPLWLAAKNYNVAVVKTLLNNGATYENGLLEWIRENSLDRAKTAAGKMVAGGYNSATESFVLQKFNEIEELLKVHFDK